MCYSCWACSPQLPKPAHSRAHKPKLLKPSSPRASAPQKEKPGQWEAHILPLENSPCSLQLESGHRDAATKQQGTHSNKGHHSRKQTSIPNSYKNGCSSVINNGLLLRCEQLKRLAPSHWISKMGYYPYDGILFSHKRNEVLIDNRNEPWKPAKWKKLVTQEPVLFDSICMVCPA